MTANTLFIIIVAIYVIDFAFSRYLSWRNIKASSLPIPEELSGIYDEERYGKQQDYLRINSKLGLVASTFSFVIIMAMLLLKGFALIDGFVAGWTLHSTLHSIVFFAILYIANDLLQLPFAIYDVFVVEERFGFNRTTPTTFILDKLKGYLLTAVIGGGILWTIITIFNLTPEYFWLLAWGVVTLFSLIMGTFYSNIIVPLFNKQTPLEEGPLRIKIEEFSQKVGFNLQNIYTIDGSKRSSKANAYFTGMFGKKRIVLYDTLIAKMTEEEIVAVLSHEIGHCKHRHTLKNMLITFPANLLLFWLLSIVLGSDLFAQAFGVVQASFHINILVFGILYTPISTALDIAMSALSRRFEYQADEFSKNNGQAEALISALRKLAKDSLSNLTPDSLVVKVSYSHPTLYQRIKALI